MTNIDEQLLNTNQQNEAAGVLKEKKKGGSGNIANDPAWIERLNQAREKKQDKGQHG